MSLTYHCFERNQLLRVIGYLTCTPMLTALVERYQNVLTGINFQGASTANNCPLEALGVGPTCSMDKCGSGWVIDTWSVGLFEISPPSILHIFLCITWKDFGVMHNIHRCRGMSAGLCCMMVVQFEANNGTSYVLNGDIDKFNIISSTLVLKIK